MSHLGVYNTDAVEKSEKNISYFHILKVLHTLHLKYTSDTFKSTTVLSSRFFHSRLVNIFRADETTDKK